MACAGADQLGSCRIPEPDGIILADDGESVTVGRERCGKEKSTEACPWIENKIGPHRTALGIPQFYGATPTKRREHTVVGREYESACFRDQYRIRAGAKIPPAHVSI